MGNFMKKAILFGFLLLGTTLGFADGISVHNNSSSTKVDVTVDPEKYTTADPAKFSVEHNNSSSISTTYTPGAEPTCAHGALHISDANDGHEYCKINYKINCGRHNPSKVESGESHCKINGDTNINQRVDFK